MAWLELTYNGKPVLVNMANVLRASAYEGRTRLITMAPEKEGTRSFSVEENIEEVAKMLARADEVVLVREKPGP